MTPPHVIKKDAMKRLAAWMVRRTSDPAIIGKRALFAYEVLFETGQTRGSQRKLAERLELKKSGVSDGIINAESALLEMLTPDKPRQGENSE